MCSATGSCICNDPAEQSLDCSGHEVTGTIGNADDNDTQLLHNLSIVTENSTVVAASPDSAGADTAAAIAGGISGAIVFILIVGILFVCACRARKQKKPTAAQLPTTATPNVYPNVVPFVETVADHQRKASDVTVVLTYGTAEWQQSGQYGSYPAPLQEIVMSEQGASSSTTDVYEAIPIAQPTPSEYKFQGLIA